MTPLQLAAKNGHYEVVRCLVIAGADLDLINDVSGDSNHFDGSFPDTALNAWKVVILQVSKKSGKRQNKFFCELINQVFVLA